MAIPLDAGSVIPVDLSDGIGLVVDARSSAQIIGRTPALKRSRRKHVRLWERLLSLKIWRDGYSNGRPRSKDSIPWCLEAHASDVITRKLPLCRGAHPARQRVSRSLPAASLSWSTNKWFLATFAAFVPHLLGLFYFTKVEARTWHAIQS